MGLLIPTANESYLLELIIIPALVSIVSLILCEHLLFGKERWNKLNDTTKAVSMFYPISAGLYFYFWLFLSQFELHGAKLFSLYIMPFGFICSIILLGLSISHKRLALFPSIFLLGASFFSVVQSSELIWTFLAASKGYGMFVNYLADTHLLETGWTYIIGFGLLTPAIYLTLAIFIDPVNRVLVFNELENEQATVLKNKLRVYLSFALTIYSFMPIGGSFVLAPVALLVSIVSIKPLREFKIWMLAYISFILSILCTLMLIYWFLT